MVIIDKKKVFINLNLGYGNMVPRTDWGKIATIIYAIIGNIIYFMF